MKLHINYLQSEKQKRLLKNGSFAKNIDQYLAITTAFGALFLTVWLFTTVHKYVEVGITLLLSSTIYLIIRQVYTYPFMFSTQNISVKSSVYPGLNLAFMIVFAYSIIELVFRSDPYARPSSYFIMITFLAIIMAIEIQFFSTKFNIIFTLSKICLLCFSLLWIPHLINPGLSGVDTWAHQNFTQKILESGTIPEGLPYSKLPVMHLVTGTTSLITGLDYKYSALFSISLFQINSLLIIFLLGKRILNVQTGLLAALVLGIGVEWLPWGISPVPTSLGGIYLIFLIYIIVLIGEKHYPPLTLILIGGIWALILTHTVSTLAFCILLFSFGIGFYLYKKIYRIRFPSPVTIWLFLFCVIGMFFWWIYISKHISLLRDLIHLGFKFDVWNTSTYHNQYMAKVTYFDYFLNLFPVLLFYGLSVAGSFAMLAPSVRNKYSFPVILGGGLLAAIGFIGLPLGLSGFLPHRWWYYSYLILALPVAISILMFSQLFRNFFMKLLVYILLVTLLVFFSISNPTVNYDRPFYSEEISPRNVFTLSELSAMNTLAEIHDGSVGVATSSAGYYYIFNLNKSVVDISPNLFSKDFSQASGVAIMITNEIVYRYFDSSGGGFKLDYDPRNILDSQKFNHIYENKTSYAYLKP